jgi:DNA-binding transcriptional ArsR family regulator
MPVSKRSTRIRSRGEEIRRFILENVEQHSADIGKITSEKFDISRQAVNKHLKKLAYEGSLSEAGKTRSRLYTLAPISAWEKEYEITPSLAEDWVWSQDMAVFLGTQPENVKDIWHFGFTEMLNNAIDHSGGSKIHVLARKTATTTDVILSDNGIGIFKKIQSALNLLDESHAVLELAKGKFTTDPKRHTGQGIFFTSRLFDSFDILSGGVLFSHQFGEVEDWILERQEYQSGTSVWMKLHHHTSRTCKKIFDEYSSEEDDYGFTKTVVPVKLAKYGSEKLISRSQAKRMLARVELFSTVILDFADVEIIGQAFADEIFRVFASLHPEISILPVNANADVQLMISRATQSPTRLQMMRDLLKATDLP